MGAVALVAAVAFTLPAAASTVDLGKRVADNIWPNDVAQLTGSSNPPLLEIIWPNAPVLGGSLGDDQDAQGDQDNQN